MAWVAEECAFELLEEEFKSAAAEWREYKKSIVDCELNEGYIDGGVFVHASWSSRG